MAMGLTNEENYINIANAIREKNGSEQVYLPSDMAGAILGIYDGFDFTPNGFTSEYNNEFNDFIKESIIEGERVRNEVATNIISNWYKRFDNNKKLFNLKIDCSSATNLNNAFSNCRNLNELILENTENVTSWEDSFSYNCSMKKIVANCKNATSLRLTFYYCNALEYIDLGSVENCVDFSISVSQAINTTTIKFVNWKQGDIQTMSRLLLPESIHYIIQNAMDVADGATARTLTLHATAKTNWQNSEYYEQDLAVLEQKGITIA